MSQSAGEHEQQARQALRDHVLDRASAARSRHPAAADWSTFFADVLTDREVTRYPVEIVFDAAPLEPGEFAWTRAKGDRPADGFELVIHPRFEMREDLLPRLAAYHLVSVNYGDIAAAEDAELFGATLLGLDVEAYYQDLCRASDEVAG